MTHIDINNVLDYNIENLHKVGMNYAHTDTQ